MNLKVIVTNYIHSPSNCLASSAFYSVCCLDECEAFMDKVEEMIQKPLASSSEITSAIASINAVYQRPSASADLLARLDEIAEYHGGAIPLHGRLFAQWMHHAFPQECSYPHMSGTTNPLRADDFQAQTGLPVSASRDEMSQFVDSGSPRRRSVTSLGGQWHFEEELYVSSKMV